MKDDIKRTPLEEAGIWVGRVSRRRFQLSEILLEQMGVGPGQVPMLTELDYHGEMTQRELAEHTRATEICQAREEGLEQGRTEGEASGRAAEKIEMAKAMKDKGYSTDEISELTGLSSDEIKKL